MKARVHPTLEDLVELQFQAKGFSLLPRQPVESLLAGQHGSRLRGRGLTFEELRGYRPGDDIRSIDWKATARLRSPQVRIYSEERERPVLFVVDQRIGMFFGSERTTKATAAAELTALGAWRVLDVKDRVGAVIFGDEEIVQIRPRRSRQTVLHLCTELVRMNRKLSVDSRSSGPTILNEALKRAGNVATHDYLIVLVTDYDGGNEQTRRLTSALAAHNDVLAVLIYDPFGINLPIRPGLEVTDGVESQPIPETDRFHAGYERVTKQYLDKIRSILGLLKVPILPICTHDPVDEQIRDALGQRP